MDLNELMQRLDGLHAQRQDWHRTVRLNSPLNGERYTAEVGPLRLHIAHDDAGTNWAVEDIAEERMVSSYWSPANGLADAMRHCTDFARAYLHTLATPVHLEN